MELMEMRTGAQVAIKNLLFATDFSEASETALPYVAALSLRYGGMIHLAHVLPDVMLLRPGAPDPAVIGSIYEDAHSAAQEKIQDQAKAFRGYPHRTYVRHGATCETLAELVREQNIDLIVVGTHGRTGLGRLVLGSVAEQIVRQASCPVLTVGPRVARIPHERRNGHAVPPVQISVRQVLCATDFKQDASDSVSYAVSFAREFRAQLALLHVIEDYGDHPYEKPGRIESTLRRLEELVPQDAGLKYPPEALAEFGSAAEGILQIATEREADLIVLGVRPTTGSLSAVTRFAQGVAYRVIVGAQCPVLTVRS